MRTKQTHRLINTLLIIRSQQLSVAHYWMNKKYWYQKCTLHNSSKMPFFSKVTHLEKSHIQWHAIREDGGGVCGRGKVGRWWGNVTFPHIFKKSVEYMQNIVGNSKTKSSSWNTTTYSTVHQNTFTNRLNEVHGMHLLQNREVKHFVIKSVGDSEKILIFERGSLLPGRIREFFGKTKNS